MTEWLDERSMQAWLAYVHLRMRVEGEIAVGLDRDGLSGADYEVLVSLSNRLDGRMRAKDLAKAMSWHKARLSRQLARMDNRGLLRRTPAPDDARGIVVELTPQGRTILDAAAPKHAALIKTIFADQLTDHEAQALISLSAKVIAAADAYRPTR